MLFLFTCVGLLVLGYFTYGAFVERVFGPEPARRTPAYTKADGVDYVNMPTWKVFSIQLLDIAGLGPIFGPILGALYGPQAMLWVVVGCIFGGAVHDYFSGMLSVRGGGKSIPEVVGDEMGNAARHGMRLFSVVLLMLVGVVFILGPAGLLSQLTGWSTTAFVVAIFGYYFIATILPINKIIGPLYPIFGFLLVFMTFGVAGGLIFSGVELIPNMDFTTNVHPGDLPLWPMLFITLSCGAISGFHCTQSPLMARCMRNESEGRRVFYGAMVMEGVIALVWVAVGVSFYQNSDLLQAAIAGGGSPAAVVNEVCNTLLGPVGGFLAVLGVIVLPITSGDTAFRSTRLIVSETFRVDQSLWIKRLAIAVPLFAVAYFITQVEFGVVWRYFGWSNQTLATLMLWAAAFWLAHRGKFHWICSIPGTFMLAVVVAFILQAGIGFGLPAMVANVTGVAVALAAFVGFVVFVHPVKDVPAAGLPAE